MLGFLSVASLNREILNSLMATLYCSIWRIQSDGAIAFTCRSGERGRSNVNTPSSPNHDREGGREGGREGEGGDVGLTTQFFGTSGAMHGYLSMEQV